MKEFIKKLLKLGKYARPEVQLNRKKLKESPKSFLKENVFAPTWKYWKEQPFHALGTFLLWAGIWALGFAGIQTLNNDFIYCDSTIDAYDGKLMLVYNDFVNYYNQKAVDMEKNLNPLEHEKESLIVNFNEEYKMICNYNFDYWLNQSIRDTGKSLGIGLKKILTKQS